MSKSEVQRLSLVVLVVLCALVREFEAAERTYANFQDDEAETQRALTPSEWTRLFQCKLEGQDALIENSTTDDPDEKLKQLIEWNEVEARQWARAQTPWYKRFWFSVVDECNRDQFAWRFSYTDELGCQFEPKILDRTPDERLANIITTVGSIVVSDQSYFKFNSGDTRQDLANELSIAGANVDAQQCSHHLAEMSRQLDELTILLDQLRQEENNTSSHLPSNSNNLEPHHLRLVRVLDAYGRYESGAMWAHSRLMGDYEQCIGSNIEMRQQDSDKHPQVVGMRFCWAHLNLRNQMSDLLRDRRRQEFETGDHTLAVGVCLPQSCHSNTLNANNERQLVQKLLNSQLEMPRSLYVKQHLEVESVFCLVDADSSFGMPTSGKLWIAFALVWSLTCCLVTWLRVGEPKPENHTSNEECSLSQLGLISMKDAHTDLQVRGQYKAREHERTVSPSKLKAVASCFNLRLSWNDFTSDRRQQTASDCIDLDVLNPIKIFACVFCVCSHVAIMLATLADKTLFTVRVVESDPIIMAMLLSSAVIDTFFVLSGLLLAYVTLRKLCSKQTKTSTQLDGITDSSSSSSGVVVGDTTCHLTSHGTCNQHTNILEEGNSNLTHRVHNMLMFLAIWLALAANRYLRLVPLYTLAFWFMRDVLIYSGSGPLWDFGFNKETLNGACLRESWTTPLTFMSAFTPMSRQCLVPSWSVSNDIFFALVLPPFLLGLASKRFASLTLKLMGLISFASIAGSLYAYSESLAPDRFEMGELRLHGMITPVFNSMSAIYTSPLWRAPCFMAGVLGGFALFKYKQRADSDNKDHHNELLWPRWFCGPATWAAIVYLLGHTLLNLLMPLYLKPILTPYHRFFAAQHMTFDRPLWAASNAILFLRMVTDWRAGPIMSKFASQTWRSLARLNYATLFIHWILIIFQSGLSTSATIYSYWQTFTVFVATYSITLPTALLVHIIFENPLDKLLKRHVFGL